MCLVWFLFAITTISVTYTLGRGPVNEYKYIFGLKLDYRLNFYNHCVLFHSNVSI